MSIPLPSIKRLSRVYGVLEDLSRREKRTVSSEELGRRVGEKAHTIRKDVNYLGGLGASPAGYSVERLGDLIRRELRLETRRGLCIVGLNGIGLALLQYHKLLENHFPILAGFDTNINLLETLKTPVPLHPMHRIEEVVRREDITLAIVTIDRKLAPVAAEKLIKAGVGGIINFSRAILRGTSPPGARVIDFDLLEQLRLLTALISLSELSTGAARTEQGGPAGNDPGDHPPEDTQPGGNQ